MQPSAPPIAIPLFPMLPPALRQWAQPLEPALRRLLVPGEVMDGFDLARRAGTGAPFSQRLLTALDIQFKIDDCDRKSLPAGGPAVIVAKVADPMRGGAEFRALVDACLADSD